MSSPTSTYGALKPFRQHTTRGISLSLRTFTMPSRLAGHLWVGRAWISNAKLHKLDLLPFVRELWIRTPPTREPWVPPRKFDRQTLRHFSAPANVQQLRIEKFDLSKFVPGVERYFEHFALALRSISLKNIIWYPTTALVLLVLPPNLNDTDIKCYSLLMLASPRNLAPEWRTRFLCLACGIS